MALWIHASCLSGRALRFCYESRVLPHDPPFSTTELETIGADRQPVAPKQQLTGCLLRPQAGLFTIEAQVSGTVVGGTTLESEVGPEPTGCPRRLRILHIHLMPAAAGRFSMSL